MTFEDTVEKIDKEIYRLKDKGKRLWFNMNIEIDGFLNQLENYYKNNGYMIEVRECQGCKNKQADIIIYW